MANPWEQYQQQPPEAQAAPPWQQYGTPPAANDAKSAADQPRVVHGAWDAWVSGYQQSATGLTIRGKLPDITLDPQHTKWYESLLQSAGSMVSDIPEMVMGAGLGAAEGAPGGPVASAVMGGAGAFMAPTAIRESLMQAYKSRQADSSADFLSRVSIVIGETGKSGLVGAVTGGAGKLAEPFGLAAKTGAELAGMTVTPAALEGRLPEPQDIANAAIMIGGMHTAVHVAGKLATIYEKTGIPPEQVVADAKVDPTIKEDLLKSVEPRSSFEPGTPERAAMDKRALDASAELAARKMQAKRAEAGMPEPSVEFKSEDGYFVDHPEIPRAYRPIAAQMAAREAFNPERAQKVLDSPYSDLPEAKLPHQLNLETIEGPDSLKAVLTSMSDAYNLDIEKQRGGTQSHADTEAKARQQLNDMTGGLAAQIMTGREPGTAANAVELKIRGDMLMQASVEAGAKIKAYQDAVKAGTVTEQMKMDALTAIHKSAMIQAEFTGAAAEVGRALEYMKRIKELRTQGKRIQEMVDMYGSDPEKLLDMAKDMDTPEAMARFAREATKATTWEKIIEGWKAGLVSGPVTHLANILGNTTFAALRIPIDAVAAGIGALRGADVGERLSMYEPLARVAGIIEGTKAGLKQGMAMIQTEQAQVGKAESFKKAIEGKKGEIIRLPFRALGAEDQVFRAMNEHGEAFSLATQQALKEGLNPSSREFRERTMELVQNPTADMTEQIDAAGKRFTFNADLGDKGRAVQTFVKAWHLEWAVPFIRTPANIAKELLRMSPMAPFISEWRADIQAGGIARDRAMAEIMVGTGVMATVISYAMNKNISGAGDPDPAKRRVQVAAGWQPYSIKINDTWYNYQRLQPLGTLVGMAADVAEVWEHMDENEADKIPKMIATAFANAITNQTFLQGITTIINAMSDPTRFGPNLIQSFASSTVPNIIGQPTAMYDPFTREVNSVREAVMARIPGLRDKLLPNIDVFGEPKQTKERLGIVTPMTETDVSKDKVRSEAARLEIGLSKAPKSIELPAMGDKKLGKVELTPEQQNVFAGEAGKALHRMMDPIVNSPGWDTIPKPIQKLMFSKVEAKARQMGSIAAFPGDQRMQEAMRINEALRQEMKQ